MDVNPRLAIGPGVQQNRRFWLSRALLAISLNKSSLAKPCWAPHDVWSEEREMYPFRDTVSPGWRPPRIAAETSDRAADLCGAMWNASSETEWRTFRRHIQELAYVILVRIMGESRVIHALPRDST